MENKLISMVDFVIKTQHQYFTIVNENKPTFQDFAQVVVSYAQFLKRPLTLNMFVPCNEDGNVIEEPKYYKDFMTPHKPIGGHISKSELRLCEHYQKAKEKVLFKGVDCLCKPDNSEYPKTFLVEYKGIPICSKYKYTNFYTHTTIEDLIKLDITLTAAALKQIGINQ